MRKNCADTCLSSQLRPELLSIPDSLPNEKLKKSYGRYITRTSKQVLTKT